MWDYYYHYDYKYYYDDCYDDDYGDSSTTATATTITTITTITTTITTTATTITIATIIIVTLRPPPQETLKTKLINLNMPTMHGVSHILRTEGATGLYQGLLSTCLKQVRPHTREAGPMLLYLTSSMPSILSIR